MGRQVLAGCEFMQDLFIRLHERTLLRDGPSFELFLSFDRFFDPLEDLEVGKSYRSTFARVRARIQAIAMFCEPTLDIIRHTDIERSIVALDDVDIVDMDLHDHSRI